MLTSFLNKMECHVCLESFDAGERRPKCLPCGHTFCLRCLLGLQARCPLDNKVLESPPQDLPDNLLVLQLATRLAEPAAPRVWCRTCNMVAVALERCMDEGHALCTLKKARSGEAEPLLQALRQDEAGLAKLGETLDSAAHDLDLEAGRPQLEEAKAGLAASRARLQDAVGANAAVWEQAKQAVEQGGLLRGAARLSASLCDRSTTCSLTVPSDGEAAWRGEVRPAEDAAARLLLCQMACRGALQPQDELRPAAPRWQERRNEVDGELSVEEMAARMTKGSRVARGRDWDPRMTYDGTPPGPGTVSRVRGDGTVSVWWDSSPGDNQKAIGHSMGKDGTYRLRLLPSPLDSLYVTDLENTLDASSSIDAAVGKNLAEVRSLVGLNCDANPAGSLSLLQRVAPHLQGLQMVSPQQRHLDAALAMPQLRALSLTNVTAEPLRQVAQMASLERLEVHCTFGVPLPVLEFPAMGLKWLRCGVYPLAAALALVRANADSLEELQLVAASEEPYGCPDLAAELRRCGFKKLETLELLRSTAYGEFCRHDKVSCGRQMIQLYSVFDGLGTESSVACIDCNMQLSFFNEYIN